MYSPVWQCLLGLSRGHWLWLLLACSLSSWRSEGLASQPGITDVLDTLSPLTVILKSIFSTLPPNRSFQSSGSIILHLAEGSPVAIGKTHKVPYLARAFYHLQNTAPTPPPLSLSSHILHHTVHPPLPFLFLLPAYTYIFHQAKHLVDFYISFRTSSLYSCVEHQNISYIFASLWLLQWCGTFSFCLDMGLGRGTSWSNSSSSVCYVDFFWTLTCRSEKMRMFRGPSHKVVGGLSSAQSIVSIDLLIIEPRT